MRKGDGRGLWIELLRPVAWIEEHRAAPDTAVWLDLAEIGTGGEADVLAVEPCPAITPGPGAVVTGRFVHETDGSDVVSLRLEGQPEPIGATANHPFWSLDRAAFVEAGNLAPGERLDAPWGAVRAASVEASAREGLLYNIETTEHVFRVGPAGTLVHNNCATNFRSPAKEKIQVYEVYSRKTGQVLYVGQVKASRGLAARLAEHLRHPGKSHWKQLDVQIKTIKRGNWTKFVAHAHEMKAITQRGGIAALENIKRPIAPKTFERFKSLHNRVPRQIF